MVMVRNILQLQSQGFAATGMTDEGRVPRSRQPPVSDHRLVRTAATRVPGTDGRTDGRS